jgi:hypothetical protein
MAEEFAYAGETWCSNQKTAAAVHVQLDYMAALMDVSAACSLDDLEQRLFLVYRSVATVIARIGDFLAVMPAVDPDDLQELQQHVYDIMHASNDGGHVDAAHMWQNRDAVVAAVQWVHRLVASIDEDHRQRTVG